MRSRRGPALRRTSRSLRSGSPEPGGPPPVAGPAGALLLTLLGSASFRVDWGRPQPGMFASRHAAVLARDDGEPGLVEALRGLFETWRRRGITPVEIVGPD